MSLVRSRLRAISDQNIKEDDMSRKALMGIITVALVLGIAPFASAAEESAKTAGVWSITALAVAIGSVIGIAVMMTSLSMSYAIRGALEGIARNPEAGGRIMTTMIIGLALIESLCIYALLISFILVFKIPDLGPILEAIVKTFGG